MADFVSENVAATSHTTPSALPAILVGGLIVGVLDLIYAIVVYSPHKPILVPQAIASGLLGRESYSGGAETAALGVALHFLIYGALVYGFMHLVVVPLSAASSGHAAFIYKLCEFVEHWFCVGLPIALSVRNYSR